jgi:hypothetical protein
MYLNLFFYTILYGRIQIYEFVYINLYMKNKFYRILHTKSNVYEFIYRLVWATKLLLAAIGLVFPALLGYNSFNCSMYHVPVPMLFG